MGVGMLPSQEGLRGRGCGNTHISRGLGVHNEQLGIVEEGDGLLTAFDPGVVLLFGASIRMGVLVR
jgi:hypothetical protein